MRSIGRWAMMVLLTAASQTGAAAQPASIEPPAQAQKPLGVVLVVGVMPERHSLAAALAPLLGRQALLVPAVEFVREGRDQGFVRVAYDLFAAQKTAQHIGARFVVLAQIRRQQAARTAHVRILDVGQGKVVQQRDYPLPARSQDIWPEAIAGDVRADLERNGLLMHEHIEPAQPPPTPSSAVAQTQDTPEPNEHTAGKPATDAAPPAAARLHVCIEAAPTALWRHGRLLSSDGRSVVAATSSDGGLGRPLGGATLALQLIAPHLSGRLELLGAWGRYHVDGPAITPLGLASIYQASLRVGPRFVPRGLTLAPFGGLRADARPIPEGAMAGYTALGLWWGGELKTPRGRGVGLTALAAFLGPGWLGGEAWRAGRPQLQTGFVVQAGPSFARGRLCLGLTAYYEQRWTRFLGPSALMIASTPVTLRLRDTLLGGQLKVAMQW